MEEVALSVVIPAFNASGFINHTTRDLADALHCLGVPWEVIVVDDGSQDDTCGAVFEHPRIRVLRLAKNSGKGAAVRAGMLAARGHVRVFTDADLPYGTQPFALALEYIERRGFHAVIGDRALPGSEYGHSTMLRRVISAVASFLFRTVVTGGMYDTQCGFKAIRGDVANALFQLVTIKRFAFDVEIIYLLLKYNLDIKRIQVRLQHESPSTVRVIRDTTRAIRDIAQLRWNWIHKRYDSPTLSSIFLADIPRVSARELELMSGDYRRGASVTSNV